MVFRASGGPTGAVLGAPWCPLELLGRSWPLLGRCWAPLGPLLALLGPLWGSPWAPPGPFWAALRASWASVGGPGALLAVRLALEAENLKIVDSTAFFLFFRTSGSPPGASWGAPGGSWSGPVPPKVALDARVALKAARGRPQVAPGGSWAPLALAWPSPRVAAIPKAPRTAPLYLEGFEPPELIFEPI